MKEKKIQTQDRRRITTHFIPLLPQLLAKFSADVEKISLLLKLPLYFDLEMYSSSRQLDKYLGLLLSQVCDIVKKHTNDTVLEACSRLINTLCSDCNAFASRAHLAFDQLLDNLIDCFSSNLNDLLQGTADEDDVYTATTALKRIAAFSSAKDLTAWKLFHPCVKLLKTSLESAGLDKEVMVAALKCAALHLMWAKTKVVNSEPAQGDMQSLKQEVRSFCSVCQTCVCLEHAEIRDQAFELWCDVLLIYSETLVRFERAPQMLAHKPSDSQRFALSTFVLDYIFIDADYRELTADDEQMSINILRKKRNQLAGYCKLIIYGVLDLAAATDVLKHYSKHYDDFGDLIKETLAKTKLINPVQSAKTVGLSLQQMFSQMLLEEYSRKDLDEIRDLAKKLAMNFGIDLHRVRKPLVTLHKDGICFALRNAEDAKEGVEQYPNLAFFEILSEFSIKLLQEDRVKVAAFLKAECHDAALFCPSSQLYHSSLATRSVTQREGGNGLGGRGSKAGVAPQTPGANQVRTITRDSSYWLDSSIHSNLLQPGLTSTAQRQPSEEGNTYIQYITSSAKDIDSAALASDLELSWSRRVKSKKRRLSSSSYSSSIVNDLDMESHITLLSLIEENNAEDGEPETEDFHADVDASMMEPSTQHTSASVLDKLFE